MISTLPIGFQLERFQIQSILGKGGFGITYVAVDTRIGLRVAIKELLPDTIATRAEGATVVPQTESMMESWLWARERFLEEAQILAEFSHPAIVGIHNLIEANGTVYMVMDLVEGESYEARLKRIGHEPDQASLMAVIEPILEGLQEVHAKNLLHRDIKPENILISEYGQPVLIDFGSARTSIGATMTMTSIVTHGYSPIEQYQTKGRMGPWTDIYALGAVMCRAITGEKPPVAADRLMEDEFAWLSHQSFPGFSPSFLRNIDRSLMLKPEDRPKSIVEWREQWNATDYGPADEINGISKNSSMDAAGALPPPLPVAQKLKTEPLAIWSLVLSILSILGYSLGGFLLAIPAVLCGHFGIASIKKKAPREGYGYALAGLVLGYAALGMIIFASLFYLPTIFATKEKPGELKPALDEIQDTAKEISKSEPVNSHEETSNYDLNPKKSLLEEQFHAYGYVYGQKYSLELVAQKFPDLTRDSKIAQIEFESSSLGAGFKELEKNLAKNQGEKWPDTEEQILSELRNLLGKQEFSREQAVAFIAEVRNRSKGNLPEATRSALLAANPKYQENPGLEMLEGWKQTFRTKGHPKSKGVDFSISLPSSWKKREGYRPNIIQVFQSGGGHGPILCSIMAKEIPLPQGYEMKSDELDELFRPNELKDMIPEGATFVDAQSLFLEGSPAGFIVFDQIMQRLDISMRVRSSQFVTVKNNVMIFIQFGLNEYPNSEKNLDEQHEKYLPTYRTIANTLVINDNYLQN